MEPDTAFSIVSKDLNNPNGSSINQYQEVQILLQKEGSVKTKHSGIMGKNQFNSQLEKILSQMKKGEKWTIEDCEKVRYSLQVVEVGNVLDVRTPFEKAETFKAEGNASIKAKDYAKAIRSYTEAYNLIINDPSSSTQDLKLSLISNLALATLNISEFKSALEWCNIHLQESYEPNLKILYRKASANKGLKNWQAARNDIKLGIEQSGNDKDSVGNFNQLLVTLEKEEKEQKVKEKAVYGKMFG